MSRNESETRAELIDPALKAAGWGDVTGSRIRREFTISQGRLQASGRHGTSLAADYVLIYRNKLLAVIEAKPEDAALTEGLGQAKNYAGLLQTPFAYATNGKGIYQVNMHSGSEGVVEHYPTPEELWQQVYTEANNSVSYWRNRFAQVPFETKSGQWQPRYYQHLAIDRTLEALISGQDRILLTLATGTGKTAIAFQIVWKLFQSRWNLPDWKMNLSGDDEPSRRPRILFLADRNILANQAFNAFSAFEEDALVRIDPDIIRKKGHVPKNGSVFFTIFQTFMTGTDEEGNAKSHFYDYSPDFFDLVIIDECHRGGANDESTWRGILDYFKPAVQIGLTATPKRDHNVDTYAYFGEPVYVYSLKDGINDGYLTPFKVKQFTTSLDTYVYEPDDDIIAGEIDTTKEYLEKDFNTEIIIDPRERKRVELFMYEMDQTEKTLVFCANQDHALMIRDITNQMKRSSNPDYCVRVTANDGKLGEQYLETFKDNEKTIPTILTTSHKLSTGVDARNVRNIVLLREIKSMIEFKQIIGRGTRLFDGKAHFTVYDFVNAYHHFSDPEWDGEPEGPIILDPQPPRPDRPERPPKPEDDVISDPPVREKIRVKLADGKERNIVHSTSTSYWSPLKGKPVTAEEFIRQLYGTFPELFTNEAELRRIWSLPDTRHKLLEGLKEKGYEDEQLKDATRLIDAQNSDLYDVLAYIAFTRTPITRLERVEFHRSRIFAHYSDRQQEFLDFVLQQYIREGVHELDIDKLPQLLELKYHALHNAVQVLGNHKNIREMFIGFQRYLYEERVA